MRERSDRDIANNEALLKKGDEFLREGKEVEAREQFEAAAKAGESRGYIQLAFLARLADRPDLVRSYFRSAKELAELNHDALGHFACGLGHQGGWGNESCEDSNKHARYHFQKAAELNLIAAQTLLADECRLGLNGAKKNWQEYEYWIMRAIKLGDEDALLDHVENLLSSGREVDSELVDRLRKIVNADAKKLLRRIAQC